VDENQFRLFEDFNTDNLMYSWDFDDSMFYVFEVSDWNRIEAIMYVEAPFSKDFVVEQELFSKKEYALNNLKKVTKEYNWQKYLNNQVIFYSFTDTPKKIGKLRSIL